MRNGSPADEGRAGTLSPTNKSNYYAKILRELQFLTNATRPDIAYAVNKLAAYTANPSLQHVGALKQLLRYLKGTKNLGIKYSTIPQENLQIYFMDMQLHMLTRMIINQYPVMYLL